jgi:signal transduction histidine kinase
VSVYANANLAGHFLKIISFYLVYKAIVETGLTKPYALVMRELASLNETLEGQVQERTARYKEVIKELESLSYSIVHDMRGPLRAMQGYAQMLLQEKTDMSELKQAELLRRIMNAAVRQDRLVQDVLSYMQVVRRDIHVQTVDLDELFQEAVAGDSRLKAARENISVPAPLGNAMADAQALVQCFSHLLNNALKFVPSGTRPEVKVSTERNGHRVRLCVQDNGIGIPAAHHNRIFKLFERLHPQSEYEGTGLGLAVVRKLAEQMGATVGVESEPGKGSRFWIELNR